MRTWIIAIIIIFEKLPVVSAPCAGFLAKLKLHSMLSLRRTLLFGALVILAIQATSAQGFLHTSGKNIVDPSGENFILRGIGTGNWMLQEGYMMGTPGIRGTQHEFRNSLQQLIGTSRTEEFYEAWLANHFTKQDLDSMKAWGFNYLVVKEDVLKLPGHLP